MTDRETGDFIMTNFVFTQCLHNSLDIYFRVHKITEKDRAETIEKLKSAYRDIEVESDLSPPMQRSEDQAWVHPDFDDVVFVVNTKNSENGPVSTFITMRDVVKACKLPNLADRALFNYLMVLENRVRQLEIDIHLLKR